MKAKWRGIWEENKRVKRSVRSQSGGHYQRERESGVAKNDFTDLQILCGRRAAIEFELAQKNVDLTRL